METVTKEVFKKYDSKLSAVKDVEDEFQISDFTLKENQMKKANEKISSNNEKIRMSEENIKSPKDSQEKQKINI
ncbi:MAG: hypothetical protein ACJ0QH_00445 [Flavobacteriales bacterium]